MSGSTEIHGEAMESLASILEVMVAEREMESSIPVLEVIAPEEEIKLLAPISEGIFHEAEILARRTSWSPQSNARFPF